MATRLTLRLDFAGGARLGPGKIMLLEKIGSMGSISAAGRALGMSYKRAWHLVDDVNRSFCEPLVLAQPGGQGGGGAQLTPFGHDVVTRYRRMEDAARRAMAGDLTALEQHLSKMSGMSAGK